MRVSEKFWNALSVLFQKYGGAEPEHSMTAHDGVYFARTIRAALNNPARGVVPNPILTSPANAAGLEAVLTLLEGARGAVLYKVIADDDQKRVAR